MICVTELVQFWQETSNCLFPLPSDQSHSTYFVFTQMYFVLRCFLRPCLWMSAGAFAVPLSSSCSLSCTDKWLGCRRCCLRRLPATQHEPFGPRRWLRMQPLEQATRCGCLLIAMSSRKRTHTNTQSHTWEHAKDGNVYVCTNTAATLGCRSISCRSQNH